MRLQYNELTYLICAKTKRVENNISKNLKFVIIFLSLKSNFIHKC